MFVEEGGTLGQGAYVCFGLGEGGGGEGWSSYSQGIPRLTVCSLSLIFSSLQRGEEAGEGYVQGSRGKEYLRVHTRVVERSKYRAMYKKGK